MVFAQNYGLMAAGTAHGLVIVDTVQLSLTLAKCTLNAQGKCDRLIFPNNEPLHVVNLILNMSLINDHQML